MSTCSGLVLHQALVQSVNTQTGVCWVRIPALLGGQVVSIDPIGLTSVAGVWQVPAVGSQVSVASAPDMSVFTWVSSGPGTAADVVQAAALASQGASQTAALASQGASQTAALASQGASQTAALASQLVLIQAELGSRNLLDNGAFQVQQKAASVAGLTANTFAVDRFTSLIGLGTWTQSVGVDGPASTGFTKSVKVLCTTANAAPAAGAVFIFYQGIENQNLQHLLAGSASAKSLTLSFWVKSNKTGVYVAELGTGSSRTISRQYTINAASVWEYKTITVPGDVVTAMANDAITGLTVNWWLASGTTYTSGTLATTWGAINSPNRAVGQVNLADTINNFWQMTGAQLEVGSAATPFEFRSITDELRRCMRYYQVIGRTYGVWTGATTMRQLTALSAPMRIGAPTLVTLTSTAYGEFTAAVGYTATGGAGTMLTSTISHVEFTYNGFPAGSGRVHPNVSLLDSNVVAASAEL